MNKSYLVRIALIVALGGFLMGFDASVISGVVRYIEPYFDLSKLQLGWAVACLTLVATLTMLVAGPLSDKFGRKTILSYAAVLYAVSALTSSLATEFWFFIAARMIGGLGVGASLIIAPMYIAEISPAKMRGRLVSFNQLNIVLGISAAFFSNFLLLKLGNSDARWIQSNVIKTEPWRFMLGVEAIPAVIYFFSLLFVPRSPRWLAIKGKENKALAILGKINGESMAIKELAAIKNSLLKNKDKKKAKLDDLFKPSMKLVLTIAIVIAIAQQITGINAVFFYAPLIFEQSGLSVDSSFAQAVIVGLTNLAFTLVAIWLIDKVGRKPLLMVGLIGVIISMIIIGTAFKTAEYKLDRQAIIELKEIIPHEELFVFEGREFTSDLELRKKIKEVFGDTLDKDQERTLISNAIDINAGLVLFGILGFVASFACSLGPVMWVLFSELFPNYLRGIAISFAGTINSAFSFLVQLIFPWELVKLGNAFTFYLYALFALIGILILKPLLPETKGKSLEELEDILLK